MPSLDTERIERLYSVLERTESQIGMSATLAHLLNAIDNTLVISDPNRPDNPIVWVNTEFEELTGYSIEEVTGKNCRFLQGDDHDQPGVKRLREAVPAGESAHVELRNYRKDGSMFWNELFITPVTNEAGELILFLGVQNDITERKRLQQEGERLKDTLLESVQDGIVVTGPELDKPGPEIRYVNPAFEQMTGYTLAELEGKTPRLFQGEKSDPVVLRRLRESLERDGHFSGETTNYRKNGEPFQMNWAVTAVTDDQDRVTHWLSVQRDVTERRRLERELLQVSAREQARLGRDLHDNVQQTLLATKLFADNLQETYKDTPEVAHHFQTFTGYLDDAIGNLRAISRNLVSDEFEYQNFLVALERLTLTFDELHPAQFSFRYENPLTINDPEKAEHLYRIVQEALSNAVKHADASAIQVKLAHDGERYVLQIIDDGAGLPEQELPGRGMGLRSMHYRAGIVGAELSLGPNKLGGATLECIFDNSPIPNL